VARFEPLPQNIPEGTEQNHEKNRHDSWHRGRESNQTPPIYMYETIPLEPTCSANACHLTGYSRKETEELCLLRIRSCIPQKYNRCFGGTCRLHLQDRRISQARNQHEAVTKQSSACYLLHASFLLSTYYTALCHRRQNSS
jgi:hypothetical protein